MIVQNLLGFLMELVMVAHSGYTPQDPNPAVNADPRISGNAVLPTTSPYRATVFMPMLLDNNQLARDITGATNVHGTWNIGGKTLAQNGVTRYITDPEGSDSSLIKYKTVGKSGDHKFSENHKNQYGGARGWLNISASHPSSPTLGNRNNWNKDGLFSYSRDSTVVGAPNYRMSMALACFLKDGTYSLNNGTIIPYSYDNNRYIGGTVTNTLYMSWDGEAGFGDSASGGGARTGHLPYKDTRTAGIYPFFDFVQGPISPAAQGMNWSWKSTDPIRGGMKTDGTNLWKWDDATGDVVADTATTPAYIQYGYGDVPPNAKPARICAVEMLSSNDYDIKIWVPVARTGSGSAAEATDSEHYPIPTGLPIYISGLTNGGLGSDDNEANSVNLNVFPTKFDARRGATGSNFSINGWWLPRRVEYYGTVGDIPSQQARFVSGHVQPDSIVAGMAAEHFGGDNTAQAWVVYVIRPFFGSNFPANVGRYLVTAGAELRLGRNYGGQYGVYSPYMLDIGGYGASGATQLGQMERLIGDNTTNTGSTQPDAITDRYVYPYNPYTFIPQSRGRNQNGISVDMNNLMGADVIPFSAGWLCGWNTPDSNVPSSASANDTYPARPTVGSFALKDALGNFTGNRPVPRSITIQTLNSANDMKIEAAPTTVTKGDGVLRVPAPLGHDLCLRYNSISYTNYKIGNEYGWTSEDGYQNNRWIPRSDLVLWPTMRPDKWA
ncbi:MAG: hypothetical protein CM15mV29_0820 [uncultured marine virus]|nr:MAG: hypothetical protein CM15mV29_0820 [uncultured marine virus]